jgi:hypothetical protein
MFTQIWLCAIVTVSLQETVVESNLTRNGVIPEVKSVHQVVI